MKKRQSLSEEEKKHLKNIGERLRYFRKKAGFTSYEDFAYENEINRSQYSSYEAGGNIQLDTLVRILKALKVSFREFFSKGID